jgi:phage tail-like protein
MPLDDPYHQQANPAFRFVVDVEGERQGAFTECTLPSVEWEVQELKEGGLNTYTHQLPGRRKSARLSLKNGVGKSQLLQWYLDAVGTVVSRKPVTVTLLDLTHQPLMVWNIQDAYPIKWTGPQLKSDGNTIAIQTLELVCGEVTVSLENG